MKYISRTSSGTVDLTAYETYLEREADTLAHLVSGSDLLSVDRFCLGPRSFHDARLTRLVFKAAESPAEGDSLELWFRGPYFDREFQLGYQQLKTWSIESPISELDLLTHEIRLECGLLVHEMLFDLDRRIEVRCERVLFREHIDGTTA